MPAKKYWRTDIEKTPGREIRNGKLEVIREGKPVNFILKEFIYYIWLRLQKNSEFYHKHKPL